MNTHFRPLTEDELELVSGGADIVVTGKRPGGGGNSWGGGWGWGGGGGGGGGNDSGGDEGGGGGDYRQPPAHSDCQAEATGKAVDSINRATATDGIRDSSNRQPEYGVTVAKDGNGGFTSSSATRGESYAQSDQPATSLNPPLGFDWEDVVVMAHSHPTSGNADLDRANRAPSGPDWLAADEAVRRGADADELTIVIVDHRGDARVYEYQTPEERGATDRKPEGNVNASDGERVTDENSSC